MRNVERTESSLDVYLEPFYPELLYLKIEMP